MAVAGFNDLFAVGLGCDLAGAYLLAQGLLTSPDAEYRRTMSQNSFASWNVRAAEDRADGRAGVIGLCTGFLLQAVAYVLQIGGVSSHTNGTGAGVVAAVCVAAGLTAVLAFARTTRWPWTRSYLVEVAHYDYQGRQDTPDGQELYRYARISAAISPASTGATTTMKPTLAACGRSSAYARFPHLIPTPRMMRVRSVMKRGRWGKANKSAHLARPSRRPVDSCPPYLFSRFLYAKAG